MKVLITGATGMVGLGVLYECIEDSRVTEIILINRKPIKKTSKKIKEYLLKDFNKLSTLRKHFYDLDAVFHCMGISSIGVKEEQFKSITFDITEALVDTVYSKSPQAVFNYVSGTGTDETEKGKIMWARVKGRTENYIINKGFKDSYMFRAGAIIPEKGIKSSTIWYNAIYIITRPFFPLMKRIPSITTTTKLGKAMINSVNVNQNLKRLEGNDINTLAK